MNHLTDEQLVLLLYGESDGKQDIDQGSHLDHCSQCNERYQQLDLVRRELTSFETEDRDCRVDVQAIFERESPIADRIKPSPSAAHRGVYQKAVLAASVLLLIGGPCFLAGMQYQSQRSSDLVNDQISTAFDEYEARNQLWQSNQIDSQVNEKVKTDFSRIEILLADQGSKITARDLAVLKILEARIAELIDEQVAVRRDLQTLAVNAEEEISITKDEIRRLEEFISSMGSPGQ